MDDDVTEYEKLKRKTPSESPVSATKGVVSNITKRMSNPYTQTEFTD
jgi:hypothetical protein